MEARRPHTAAKPVLVRTSHHNSYRRGCAREFSRHTQSTLSGVPWIAVSRPPARRILDGHYRASRSVDRRRHSDELGRQAKRTSRILPGDGGASRDHVTSRDITIINDRGSPVKYRLFIVGRFAASRLRHAVQSILHTSHRIPPRRERVHQAHYGRLRLSPKSVCSPAISDLTSALAAMRECTRPILWPKSDVEWLVDKSIR